MVVCAHLKEFVKHVLQNSAKPDLKFLLTVKPGLSNLANPKKQQNKNNR